MLHHGVTTNDSRITEITITIEDDTELAGSDSSGCIRTRSQRGTLQYHVKEISIFVKILKLIIYELSNCLESAMAFAEEDDETETDGEVNNNLSSLKHFYFSFPANNNLFVFNLIKAERRRHA